MVVGKSPMASLLVRRERSMAPPAMEKATIYSALKFQQLKAEVRKRGLMTRGPNGLRLLDSFRLMI